MTTLREALERRLGMHRTHLLEWFCARRSFRETMFAMEGLKPYMSSADRCRLVLLCFLDDALEPPRQYVREEGDRELVDSSVGA